MADYAQFRQQLDTVLRTRDAETVRQFLIEQGQWDEEIPADPQFAMWMMIASSPALRDLHEQARTWLIEHDHVEEAHAVLDRGKEKQHAGAGGKKGSTRGKTGGKATPTRASSQRKSGAARREKP
ncbi:MAG TPA: hypothetical protein VL461_06835 [Dictyobacter sp.]|jgi:hypothetical protein|nr:hypothetical protein [Dictyobacter sp.]